MQECMKPFGGFDHNDQSLRVLTTLERKYPEWNGLNLSWETLEGVVKHNGPLKGKPFIAVRELQAQVDLRLKTFATVEAQVAAISDDIAYNNHDVEDGLRAGLFTLSELEKLQLLRDVFKDVRKRYPNITERYLVQEMVREMIGAMVDDVLTESKKRLKALNAQSPDDVRNAGKPMVAFSDSMLPKVQELRGFLFERMYRHHTINRLWLKVERIVTDLFTAFTKNYQLLPEPWQRRVEEAGGPGDKNAQARIVADYIAGMTDRYAIREHEKLFDLYWDLR